MNNRSGSQGLTDVANRAALLELGRRAALPASERMPSTTPAGHLDFGAVYTEHVGFVWRLLRGLGVTEAAVADAAQDVFIVVHRRLAEFDGRSRITTWLFAIAHRVACKYRQRSIRAQRCELLDESVQDDAPDPSQAVERLDDARLMTELLDELDDDKRVVLVLAELEQLRAPEIAALTGTPVNTVYTRLRRARAQLSEALAARHRRRR